MEDSNHYWWYGSKLELTLHSGSNKIIWNINLEYKWWFVSCYPFGNTGLNSLYKIPDITPPVDVPTPDYDKNIWDYGIYESEENYDRSGVGNKV